MKETKNVVEIKDFPVYTCVGNLVSSLCTGKNMSIYSEFADSIDTNPEETARRVSEATNMPLSELYYVEFDDWKNILVVKDVDDKWEGDRNGNITLRVTVGVDMDLLKETIDKNKESDKDL